MSDSRFYQEQNINREKNKRKDKFYQKRVLAQDHFSRTQLFSQSVPHNSVPEETSEIHKIILRLFELYIPDVYLKCQT